MMKPILIALSLLVITACGTDDPKPPEASVTPDHIMNSLGEAVVVSAAITKENVTVRHNVKDKNVYVEVVIPGFNFSSAPDKKKVDGEGYIHLYLNGKKVDEIHQAAFIVKGLPSGKHNLKIELVQNDSTSYGIEEEFSVTVE
ncbi:hypothetical protein JOC85_000254 [Bacillus mesophilus]|uniref:Uncharacterized protein n=1 Tax=Bacillus mesophilus TaxID=1808955 RepID=A0A6M0Q4I2_9BACI|nr:hypothetical protein [Bacillus mesophilus]MBM7659487.1 hypothetical protein [Bacillus mesophilus]NEY70360.1 hypothetical protein [Bacillus mesophilus]